MPSEISLEQSSHMEWKRHHSLSVNSPIYNIRCFSDHLYACHGGGIDVYTTSLQRVDTIKAGDIGDVHDICSVPGGRFVVAATNGLFQHKDKGQLMTILLLNFLYLYLHLFII